MIMKINKIYINNNKNNNKMKLWLYKLKTKKNKKNFQLFKNANKLMN